MLAPSFESVSRKRPRASASDAPQRLLSFASLSAAAPRALVLPTISQLLGHQQQQSPPPPLVRQRLSVSGAFVERRVESAAAVAPAPVAAAAAAVSEDDEDDGAEDKTPWPSAAQYHDVFRNLRSGDVPVYDLGVDPRGVPLHPEFIYSQPVSCMYFLKCAQLLGKGSFGFPRKKKSAADAGARKAGDAPAAARAKKESSKDFEWRKMSFVTGLPKKQPLVRYITATCYSRASDVAAKKKVFRMHAVMLANDAGDSEAGDYVLVHIRAGGSKRVGLRATAGDAESLQEAPASPLPSRACDASGVAVPRPISPPMVTAPSYDSQAASSSPRNKKLLHADFSSGHYARSQAGGKLLLPRNPLQLPPLSPPSRFAPEQRSPEPPMARHPVLCAAPPAFDARKLDTARQAMRDLILHSCSSRDEMAKYVLGLQEELAALQQQTQ